MKPFNLIIILVLGSVAALPGAALRAVSESGGASLRTVELSVQAAAEPVPALTCRLLPALSERKPGNAAQYYYRALALLPSKFQETYQDKIDQWQNTNLVDLPREEVGKALDHVSGALKETASATRRQVCHWDMPLEDGLGMLLPGLSQFRVLSRILALQARLQMANQDYARALNSLAAGFGLGHDVGKGPTLIQGLVGIAIGRNMLQQVEQWVQLPGAPNLYWALTALPQPYVNLRPAIELENEFLYLQFPQLKDLRKTVLSTGEAQRLLVNLVRLNNWAQDSHPSRNPAAVLMALAIYPQAKQALIKQGYTADVIESMPSAQVTIIYWLEVFQRYSQAQIKWFYVPFPQAFEEMKMFDQRLKDEFRTLNQKLLGLPVSMLLPSLSKIYLRTIQFERDVAALRCVEALRMHAAQNAGQLPGSLKQIKCVPVPPDPLSGTEFEYKIENGRGILESKAPPGESSRTGLKYVITLSATTTN